MHSKIIPAIFVAMMGIGSEANADFIDGNNLYERCQSSRTSALNYILGIVDAQEFQSSILKAQGNTHPNAGKIFCIPDAATAGQLTDVVCKYLADKPSKRHYTATSAVFGSFMADFPCRN